MCAQAAEQGEPAAEPTAEPTVESVADQAEPTAPPEGQQGSGDATGGDDAYDDGTDSDTDDDTGGGGGGEQPDDSDDSDYSDDEAGDEQADAAAEAAEAEAKAAREARQLAVARKLLEELERAAVSGDLFGVWRLASAALGDAGGAGFGFERGVRGAAGLFKSVGPRAIDYEGKTPVRWSTDATWFEQCCCDTRRAKTEGCRGDLRYFIQDQSQAAGC